MRTIYSAAATTIEPAPFLDPQVNPITASQVKIFLVSSVLKVLQVVTSLLALPLVAIATVMVSFGQHRAR